MQDKRLRLAADGAGGYLVSPVTSFNNRGAGKLGHHEGKIRRDSLRVDGQRKWGRQKVLTCLCWWIQTKLYMETKTDEKRSVKRNLHPPVSCQYGVLLQPTRAPFDNRSSNPLRRPKTRVEAGRSLHKYAEMMSPHVAPQAHFTTEKLLPADDPSHSRGPRGAKTKDSSPLGCRGIWTWEERSKGENYRLISPCNMLCFSPFLWAGWC